MERKLGIINTKSSKIIKLVLQQIALGLVFWIVGSSITSFTKMQMDSWKGVLTMGVLFMLFYLLILDEIGSNTLIGKHTRFIKRAIFVLTTIMLTYFIGILKVTI